MGLDCSMGIAAEREHILADVICSGEAFINVPELECCRTVHVFCPTPSPWMSGRS